MSKLIFISNDKQMNSYLGNCIETMNYEYNAYSNSKDPVDIVSEVFRINPTLLMLDDDFISPNSIKILESIKKVNSKLPIIFVTSNSSLELGRTINNIGVKYYLIKPINEENLKEFIKSVEVQNERHVY